MHALALTSGLTVTATDAAAGTSTASTTVTVNPAADSVAVVPPTEYRTSKQRLQINATSSVISPGVVLTLQPYLTEAGTMYDPNPLAGGLGNLFTNNGGGNYQISAGKLSFGPLMSTRMACPPGSLDATYTRDLQRVVSFFVQDGDLYLELPVDSGTMRFQPAP